MLKFGRHTGNVDVHFLYIFPVDISLRWWYIRACIEVAGFISSPADALGRRRGRMKGKTAEGWTAPNVHAWGCRKYRYHCHLY